MMGDSGDGAIARYDDIADEDMLENEEEHFDIRLAASHSYMGPGLVAVAGRSVLEPGWKGKIPVAAHHGVVFPGETLPMLVTQPHEVATMLETIKQDKLFGLLCSDASGSLALGVGVVCEVFEAGAGAPLSPRRLALEALCKLCVTDANVDLVLATPPRGRIAQLCAGLARDLCRPERPVVREFAVNLLHYLAGAGEAAAREVAAQAAAVAQLVAFIERAEQTALGVANQHGVAALRDNPDAMGTSLDMLRRAAATLLRLARHPANRPLVRRHERRLLSLVMSQILDQKVAHELADVLFHCTQRAHPHPDD